MSKIRVYELAKELNTSSSRLLTKLEEIGLKKNNHMSYLDETERKALFDNLSVKSNETGRVDVSIVDKKEKPKTAPEQSSTDDAKPKRAVQKESPKKSDVATSDTNNAKSAARKNVAKRSPRSAKADRSSYRSKARDSRETSHSGLLGDMKVITEDDRMRILKEKARRLKMQQKEALEKQADQSATSGSKPAAPSETEKQASESKKIQKIQKIEKIEKVPPKEAKEEKETKPSEESSKMRIDDTVKRSEPDQDQQLKKEISKTDVQKQEEKPAAPMKKDERPNEKASDDSNEREKEKTQKPSQKEESQHKAATSAIKDKEGKVQKYQKEPGRDRTQKSFSKDTRTDRTRPSERSKHTIRQRKSDASADKRPVDRKKDLSIPKAEKSDKVETKQTGTRREFSKKDTQKLDKREQKKGTDKSAQGHPKTGGYQSKKSKYRQKEDFVVGQKKDVKEVLSDDFIMDEFYEKEAQIEKRKQRRNKKQQKVSVTPKREVLKHVVLPENMTIKSFAEKVKKTSSDVIMKLLNMGVVATLNQSIDFETATLIADEFGITTELEKVVTEEDILFDDTEDEDENMKPRPPVVVVMGHVDHGKTSLLDAIKSTNVIEGEAGGITQHIGAYKVTINGRDITFLDTPGHEAFTSMRQRGAQVTDIAVLVVAADDGVMPQTVEAINHAKAANVELIVAINKMDSPNADAERVKQALTEYELVPEEWGGDTIIVPVSALKQDNIDGLLEMILLTADIMELKSNPDKQAKGTVIESRLDKSKGSIATLLVQRGTLKTGNSIVTGTTVGRIRRMYDDKGVEIETAGPSTPVEIMGLNEVPIAGDEFYAIEDERVARQLADKRKEQRKEELSAGSSASVSLDDLFSQIQEGNVKELNIILKADVHGSVEAVKQSLEKLSNDEVKVKVIHGAVGAINESDIQLATVSNAIIIGFNVRSGMHVMEVAENAGVDVRFYRVIYNAIEDIEKAMKGMLAPTFKEEISGHAQVRQIFKVSGLGSVLGCYVTDGRITRNDQIRLIREGVVVYEGKLASLKRFKDDVREVVQGYECGMSLENYNDVKEGDVVEAFSMIQNEPS